MLLKKNSNSIISLRNSKCLLMTLLICLSFITVGCNKQTPETLQDQNNMDSTDNQSQNKETSLSDLDPDKEQADIDEEKLISQKRHIFSSKELDEYKKQGFDIEGSALLKYTGADEKVVIPEGITIVQGRAFSNNQIVKEVVLPESVSDIVAFSFEHCTSLEKFNLPSGLQTIGINAFSGCSSLRSITIPESVTAIETGAFYMCTSLDDVIFEGQVHNIGISIFHGTPWIKRQLESQDDFVVFNGMLLEAAEEIKNQKEITIPEGVEVLTAAFWTTDKILMTSKENTTIEAINLPSSLIYISSSALACNNLSTINGGDNIAHVAPNIFSLRLDRDNVLWFNQEKDSGNAVVLGKSLLYWRNAEGTVEIPEGVTHIAPQAFKGSDVTEVIIPNTVTYIGEEAFAECINLVNVSLPDGLTDIKEGTFTECSSLTSIQLPNSLTRIHYDAFAGCTKLTNINLNAVIEIQAGAFANCESLASIHLSEELITIGESAFTDCISLTKVEMHAGLAELCESAFSGCINLTELVLPENLIRMDDSVFRDCSSIKQISIPYQITKIPESAFNGCTSLESIILSDNTTTIDTYAFKGCTSLVEINNSSYLKEIKGNAIADTIWAKNQYSTLPLIIIKDTVILCNPDYKGTIDIPNGVKRIGNSAFQGCDGITSVTIPETVEEIGDGAFYECVAIKKLEMPDSVKTLGMSAFAGCSSLEEVKLSSNLTELPGGKSNGAFYPKGIFEDCASLTEITIPDGITVIGGYTFLFCKSLKTITLPISVTEIGECAFGECGNLEKLVVPSSVTKISPPARTLITNKFKFDVFTGCDKLTIYGSAGSVIEQYAKDNNIPFEAMP